MKGWLVIGACVLGIVAFIGVLYILGTMLYDLEITRTLFFGSSGNGGVGGLDAVFTLSDGSEC